MDKSYETEFTKTCREALERIEGFRNYHSVTQSGVSLQTTIESIQKLNWEVNLYNRGKFKNKPDELAEYEKRLSKAILNLAKDINNQNHKMASNTQLRNEVAKLNKQLKRQEKKHD